MNYQKIYNSIISNAILRGLNKKLLNYYTEKHHIIPRCLGGSNDKSNLVLLTGREHYLCHYLLIKINKNDKLIFAYHRMLHSKNEIKNYGRYIPKLTSKEFELQRQNHSNVIKNKMFGIKFSDSHKENIGKASKNRKWTIESKLNKSNNTKSENNNFFGKHHTVKSIEKIKETIKNKDLNRLNLWKERISKSHADFSGSLHPRARRCTVNDIEFGCLKFAREYIKKNKITNFELRFI